MKTLNLKWEQHQKTSGLATHLDCESVTVGMCHAQITLSTLSDNYTLPYKLYINTRSNRTTQGKDHTYHRTIEDAKRQATEELSIAVHNMCTELGYVLLQ